jgi:adenine-specific DNA-methyltransferase
MGNKYKLLTFISDSLEHYGAKNIKKVADLFCGTGIVAHMFSNMDGVEYVHANDIEPYAVVFTKARLSNESCTKIKKRLDAYYAASTSHEKSFCKDAQKKNIITQLYGSSRRSVFTKEHAMTIDALMRVIHATKPRDTNAIASLMDSALRVNNGFGHFHSAPKNRRQKDVALDLLPVVPRGSRARWIITQENAIDSLKSSSKYNTFYDLIYIDPPYTRGHYGTSYHILNTIALDDAPQTTGQFNIRKDAFKSTFSSKVKAHHAFRDLIEKCAPKCRYVCISYSDKGIVSRKELVEMLYSSGYSNVQTYCKNRAAYKGGTMQELLFIATSTIPITSQHT